MSLRQRPASWRGLALFTLLLAVLWLLLMPQTARGQIASPSEPPTLTGNLQTAEQMLILLTQRLSERQRQVADLQSSLSTADERLSDLAESLATLQAQLEEAQGSLETSQKALRETLTSLDALSKQYEALDKSWQDYRTEMQKQVTGVEKQYKQAKRWVAIFGATTATGFLLSLFMALH